VTLSNITVIATLGVGGFGRVELVRTVAKLSRNAAEQQHCSSRFLKAGMAGNPSLPDSLKAER